MNTRHRSSKLSNWLRPFLSAAFLLTLLFGCLPNARMQGNNPPILFMTERENIAGGGFHFFESYGMNEDGSNQMRIGGLANGGFFARYSPDGQKIAYVTGVTDPNSPLGFRQQIFVMNADGTNQINISNNLKNNNAPAWSFDGAKIVFIQIELDFSATGLWIMNSDGTNQQKIFSNPAFSWYPAYSPYGNKIAFSNGIDGDDEIYVINVDGTGLQQLTFNDAHDYGPDWSPDGLKIAFNRERFGRANGSLAGNGDIYVMDADGSNQTPLTQHGRANFYPIWSPDGSQIIFCAANGYLRTRNVDIFKMNADGSNVIRLTHEPGWDFPSDWH